MLGFTPLSAIAYVLMTLSRDDASADTNCTEPPAHPFPTTASAAIVKYVVGVIDAGIYIFLPIWTTWLLRLWQGRPWLHRVAGRSVLIGDVPWVAQVCAASSARAAATKMPKVATYPSANPDSRQS